MENIKTTVLYPRSSPVGLVNTLLKAILNGLMGFALFFTVILFTKMLSTIFKTGTSFFIDIEDVYLAGLGFFLTALIKILEIFRDDKKV